MFDGCERLGVLWLPLFREILAFRKFLLCELCKSIDDSGIVLHEVSDKMHGPEELTKLSDCRRLFDVRDSFNTTFSDLNTYAGYLMPQVLHPV